MSAPERSPGSSRAVLEEDCAGELEAWRQAMLKGDFAEAWRISDRALQRRTARGETCHHWPRHLQYVWDGTPLAGKRVLVRCYHGLGDTIQFIRLAARLRDMACEVAVWVQPELLNIIARVPGVSRALPLHDGAPDVACDAEIEVTELPHALRIDRSALPGEIPYIRASSHEPRRAAGPLRVGIAWRGAGWAPQRTVPAELLRPLCHVPGVELLSLQFGRTAEEARDLPARDVCGRTIGETAMQIAGLDLVVAIDTMVAHLAGALGKPVWTLLHADCDWRWMAAGDETPWYPSMRLFRQATPGDWGEVVIKVRGALGSIAEGTTG
jgi:hypothetical protein